MRDLTKALPVLVALSGAAALAACGGGDVGGGRIRIDGSSTVYPVSRVVAERFMMGEGRGVRVVVSESGTGGGFQRFCAGETDISDASRPIKPSEQEACAANGVELEAFEVSKDGITVVVNPDNAFVRCLTTAELERIWEPDSQVATWSDVRAEWPSQEINLYGPGPESGTFDYFTHAIMGQEDRSRTDYTASEDDFVLVQGVAGDPGGLGYFGYAYFEKNRDRLKDVEVDAGNGCVPSNLETIGSGAYAPLSRPMFIYVNRSALARDEVLRFLRFYMRHAAELVPQVGYAALSDEAYQANLDRVEALEQTREP